MAGRHTWTSYNVKKTLHLQRAILFSLYFTIYFHVQPIMITSTIFSYGFHYTNNVNSRLKSIKIEFLVTGRSYHLSSSSVAIIIFAASSKLRSV